MGLLDRLDLRAIHDFLMDEIKVFDIHMIYTNSFIFMALRILDKHGISVDFTSFNQIVDQSIELNIYEINDSAEYIPDYGWVINLIKAINPNFEFPLKGDFLMEVQIAIEGDGSIKNAPTTTAQVLSTMYSLGLDASEEAKYMMKYLQFDTSYFDKEVEEKPKGLGWKTDFEGFAIELSLTYWALMALTSIYPLARPQMPAILCPECGEFFERKPKFCNICGHKF